MTARTYGQYCGVARALDLLGERWTLLIVRDLLPGPQRFADLHKRQPAMATDLLTARLRRLEEAGLVERVPLPAPASGSMYQLTEAGDGLRDLIGELARVGAQWLADPTAEPESVDAAWALATLGEHLGERAPSAVGVEVDVDGQLLSLVVAPDSSASLNYGPLADADLRLRGPAFEVLGILLGRLNPKSCDGVEIVAAPGVLASWVDAVSSTAPAALMGE
jgi:DNA-binding HxlR family transcriptional regulator